MTFTHVKPTIASKEKLAMFMSSWLVGWLVGFTSFQHFFEYLMPKTFFFYFYFF